ncbi:MAG: Ig-like domain-containing protein [Geobacter sp.]|nr:Ig-like domain-containing protein [Geobacter sp.]
MKSVRQLTLFACVVCLSLLLPIIASAEEVILYPGYIKGNVSVGSSTIESVGISAWSSGYSASKSTTGADYTVTVQGGEFDYSAQVYTLLREPGATPYSYMYFQQRTLRVPVGATVTNDYAVNPGNVRFKLNISGEPFNNWNVYAYAYKWTQQGEEQTNSYGYNWAYSPTVTSAEWDMPVVPNEQIRIYAYVYVDNKPYTFYVDYGTERYENIAAGQTVVIPLNVVHSTNSSQFGTVQGTIDLKGLDSGDFYAHSIYASGDGRTLYENPTQYLMDRIIPGQQYIRPYTYFDSWQTYLGWPYTNGRYENDLIDVQAGGYYTRDFTASTGKLEGRLLINGTMKNSDWQYLYLMANGQSAYWDYNQQQYVYPQSYGGYASTNRFGTDGSYRLYLTPGPWMPYYVSGSRYDYADGTYRSSSFSVYDYRYLNDGYWYLGTPVQIEAGKTTNDDRSYCTGSASIAFRVAGGGSISYPQVSGWFQKTGSDGRYIMYGNTSGSNSVYNVESSEVEFHGVPGNYTINCSGMTADGSWVNFAQLPMELECGVWKGRDLSSPLITLTSPQPELITNAASILVAGTASDDTGISTVTVNGAAVPFTPTGNASAPNEVGFSHELAVQGGKFKVRTEASDLAGHTSYDERYVYVDRWSPEVTIVSPAASSFLAVGAQLALDVRASDQGYGYTLKVYVDGNLVSTTNGATNDSAPVAVAYQGNITGVTYGSHTVKAVVTDVAGNSAEATAAVNVYLNADLSVKPEASHNRVEGVTTFFVNLPDGMTKNASLLPQDITEVTADPDQHPFDVKYSDTEDKLILKFSRTPELMSDPDYTVEGKFYPNPSNPDEFYYWRGSDSTLW